MSSDVTLAAIDVGTNSVHMVLARPTGRGQFEILTREKATVRLGEGEAETGAITDAAAKRCVDALKVCARLAAERKASVVAVATSAVREASNQAEFIDLVRSETGIELEVISGREEARLIHLGVLQALSVFDKPLMMVDIGGGSTEVLFGQGERVRAARSFKLGAIRTTSQFFSDGVVTAEAVERCRGHIATMLAPYAQETRKLGFEVAVGCSGTITTLVEMWLADANGSHTSTNGTEVSRQALGSVIERILAAPTRDERLELAGLESGRADIIVGGALILEGVLNQFGVDRLTISDLALREGVLLEAWRRASGENDEHLRDVRANSVRSFMERCDDNPVHAEHVAKLSLRLFDELAPVHGLDGSKRALLEAGALLANVGLVISHSRHHMHAYYMIRNSDRLLGYSERELELIAQLARFHRKGGPSESRHPEFAALGMVDRAVVQTLSAILRMAVALDRGHAQSVADVDVSVRRDVITIRPIAATGADPLVERFSAAGRTEMLARVLGRPVELG